MSHEYPSKYANIEVRDYVLGRDFEAVAELLHNEGMFNPERDRYDHLESLAPYIPMKVAVAMGKIVVGSVYINGGIGVVEGLVVHPDFRGRGIGGLLLDAAERTLRMKGHRYIELQIDEGREDLERWYKKQGFEANYKVTGMMRRIDSAPHPVDLSKVTLDRETVNRAFMDVYRRYRDRWGYFDPLDSPEEFENLTSNEEYDMLRQSSSLWPQDLREIIANEGYINPPLKAKSIAYLDWSKVDEIFERSSLLPLRDADFNSKAWRVASPTVWLAFPCDHNTIEEEHVQSWIGRGTEIVWPPERTSAPGDTKRLEEAFHTFANDTFLFLRQAKGIRRFGRPPLMDMSQPDGDFLCYDQANKNVFAFCIKGDEIESLSPEATAAMQEDLVLFAKTYETMAEGYRLKPPRNRKNT